MYVCCWATRSFVGSVARQRPVGNSAMVFSLGSVLRVRCHGIIHHLLLGRGDVFLSARSENPLPRESISPNNNQIKIPGALSPGGKTLGA
jgi:hypothetical protein